MQLCCKQSGGCAKTAAFTLAEVLIATTILALALGGILYGYGAANDLSEWSSMSLAAQSMAAQGMEQARCAQWNSQQYPYASGPGTGDELPVTNVVGGTWSTNYSGTNYAMDVPATGTPFYATNFITLTTVQIAPPLRMIRSDCVWTFPRSQKIFTNSMVTYRAPDQ